MQVLHEGLADSKYRPCPLLVKYVEAGWLAEKRSAGSTITAGSTRPDALTLRKLGEKRAGVTYVARSLSPPG